MEEVAGDAAIKGVVITSGKETFCAGADLAMLETSGRQFADMVAARGEEAATAWLFAESRKLSQLYRRIETCGKPLVAAINGTALGGGFELASPAITASRPTTTRRAWACPRSRSASSRAPAAPSGWRAC